MRRHAVEETMADKVQTLEELARIEANAVKKREQAKLDYIEGQKRLVTELPERFLKLAAAAREGVKRFNTAAEIERPVLYSETPAVTTRDTTGRSFLSFEVRRKPNEIVMSLREMTRAGAPDAFVIEGSGSVGVPPMNDKFGIRIDALIAGKETRWKIVCAHHKVDVPIDELGDRLVMVVVTSLLTRLWNTPPWADGPPDSGVTK
jgi:hypothetical protein